MAKKVLIFGDLLTTPTLEGVGSNNIGVVLSEAPIANVTVSFVARNSYFTAPGNLTFTTSNWDTPQAINIAASSNSVQDTCRYDFLDVSCSGGGYDGVTESIQASIFDSNSHHTFSGAWGWFGSAANNNKNWAAKLAQFQQEMFNGSIPTTYNLQSEVITTSPTATPLQTGNTSAFSSALWSTCTTWTFRNTDADGYNYDCKAMLIRAANPVGKLWLDFTGSGEAGHVESLTPKMLAKGYDVISMSYCPFNSLNLTNNPGISPQTGNAAVVQLITAGVERPTFNSYQLVVRQCVNTITKALEVRSYSEINVSGISGSAYPVLLMAAVDSRVTNCFYWRGQLCQHHIDNNLGGGATSTYNAAGARYGPATATSQQIWNMYKNTSFVDCVALILARGGKFAIYGNTGDSSGSSWVQACMCMEYIRTFMGVTALRCVGIYDNNSGRQTHQWSDIDFTGGGSYPWVGIYSFLGI